MPRVVSFIVLLAIILLIGSMFFQVMVQFIVPLFLAAVLVVIFKPLHLWVLEKCAHRVKLSAAVSTFLIVLIVLLPLGAMTVRAISEGAEHYAAWTSSDDDAKTSSQSPIENNSNDQTNGVMLEAEQPSNDEDVQPTEEENEGTESEVEADKVNPLQTIVDKLVPIINEQLESWEFGSISLENARSYLKDLVEQVAAPLALGGVKVLASTLVSMAIMVLTLYYFFADGPNMIAGLMKLSPLDDEYEQELLDKFADVSRAVVVAVLLSAVVQGLLAGIGYYFAGIENVFFLTMATCFLAMVPFIGAAAVWAPVCLFLFFYNGDSTLVEIDGQMVEQWQFPDGRPVAATVLGIYCLTVVSMIDNLIKPLVLHGQSNLHPLLALLSVIGGIQTLGPIGILVGPMLVAFLQALLNMLNKELHLLGKESDETGQPVVFATEASLNAESPSSTSETKPQPKSQTKTPVPKKGKRRKRK